MAAARVLGEGKIGRVDAAAEELPEVEVEALVVHDLAPGAAAAVAARRVEGAVVAVVVVDAGRPGRAAGDQREQAREGVRGRRRPRIAVGDGAASQTCQCRGRMRLDPLRQVHLVQSIHAEEKYLPHTPALL